MAFLWGQAASAAGLVAREGAGFLLQPLQASECKHCCTPPAQSLPLQAAPVPLYPCKLRCNLPAHAPAGLRFFSSST